MFFYEALAKVQMEGAQASRSSWSDGNLVFRGPVTVDFAAGGDAGICQGWAPTSDDLQAADWLLIER